MPTGMPVTVPTVWKVPARIRMKVLARDGYRCVYCGATPQRAYLHVDHVVPRVDGGSNDPTNLVTACGDCNQGKGAERLGLPTGVVPAPLAPVLSNTRMRPRITP